MIDGLSASSRLGIDWPSIFTGYNKLRANAYVNYSSGPHNLRWQIRHVSSTTQIETNSINIARNVGSTAKIAEYWQHDLTYKTELPWDTTATVTVQNIFDEDPPFAIGTQYNYDPGSGNPLGRVIQEFVKKPLKWVALGVVDVNYVVALGFMILKVSTRLLHVTKI